MVPKSKLLMTYTALKFMNTNISNSRVDNGPEFMQNLGFVADASIPEIYSFSSQIEPFLLAQTQQMPANGPSPGVKRDHQQLNLTDPSKR